METRIVKRTYSNGKEVFVIQQKHVIFRWKWVDARCNYPLSDPRLGLSNDTFNSLGEAKSNLHRFNTDKYKESVVQ
jgi:hypothetical protein